MVSELAAVLPDRFTVVVGDEHFDPSLKTRITGVPLRALRNRYLLGRRALWQPGSVRVGVRADSVILELNPRIVNVWLTLVARRVLRRPAVVWGHAWPRDGQHSRSDLLRSGVRRLATTVVVYTETQANELRGAYTGMQVVAAPNGLYSAADAGPADVEDERPGFIYVGRLVPEKKGLLMLQAYAQAVAAESRIGPLHVVGTGPDFDELKQRALDLRVADRVRFYGELTLPSELRPIYGRSVAALSPGVAGLSVIQSLWFGRPIVVANEPDHPPEIEAAIEGQTAAFFPADSAAGMATAMLSLWNSREYWFSRRAELAKMCSERYSTEQMVDRFLMACGIPRQLASEINP
jgi:glycosyltransferase involved in cell wall biosynthesis